MTISVAVTGWALRTPLGHEPDRVLDRLLAGERAAAVNSRFPADTYRCRLAAAIPGDPARSPHDRILRRTGRFGYHAAREALTMSGAATGTELGLFAGVGGLRAHWNELMPALVAQGDDFRESWQRGFRRIHPYWMLQHLSNNTHALLSKDLDTRGEGVTFGGGNAGAQAAAAAIRALADGAISAALVVSYDSLIEPETVVEMAARGAATGAALDGLRGPYDRASDGVVPGEGAACVVLEPAAAAGDRALVYLAAGDAADGRCGDPEAATIAAVLAQLGRPAAEVVIDGAAAARPELDRAERGAVAGWLEADAPLTAIQSATGHLGAAATLTQAIVLAHALRRGVLPPIAGLSDVAPGPLEPVLQPSSTQTRSAFAVSTGSPGLVGAVRISLDP